jgi:hypothetical protein
MSDDQFTKLFKYMQREFNLIHRKFDNVDKKFDTFTGAVDAFAKQTEIYHQEMLVLNHQVNRHDQWINKIAKVTDVKLSS